MAFRFDMFVTPIDSTTVTTATKPSGMAATARETAIIKELSTTSKSTLPARRTCTPNTSAHTPSTSHVSIFDSCASLSWRGVCPSLAFASASAILPISVSMPVPVMTAVPRP